MINILKYEANDYVNINGSCLQGKIQTTYLELCEVFGKPTYTDADPYEKVNAEWSVEAEVSDDYDEVSTKVFTIYNWKTGCIPTERTDWHIGGFGYEAIEIAQTILDTRLS